MLYKIIPAWIQTQPILYGLVGDRVEPNRSTQGDVKPRIVYHRISSRRVRNLHGKTGLRWTRVQFDNFGRNYAEACQMAKLLQELDGSTQTINGVTIKAALPDEERDDAKPEAGTVNPEPMVSVDIMIAHEE